MEPTATRIERCVRDVPEDVAARKGRRHGNAGRQGRTVKLHVKIDKGRIEDLMRLSVKSQQPPMVGDIALHTDFTLPPARRMSSIGSCSQGEFDVDGRFTDRDVQAKLTGMSRRASGDDGDVVGPTSCPV